MRNHSTGLETGGSTTAHPAARLQLRSWLSFLAFMALATTSSAQPGPPGQMGAPPSRESGWDQGGLIVDRAAELGLDEETVEGIREIVVASRSRGEELRFELDEAHRKLQFMLSRSAPDEAEIMNQAERIGALRLEESKHRLRALLAVRALLTPEQRELLAELRRAGSGRDSRGRGEALQALQDACGGDVERLCAEAGGGRDRVMCLREHRSELSEECARAAADLRSRMHGKSGSDSDPRRMRGLGGGYR